MIEKMRIVKNGSTPSVSARVDLLRRQVHRLSSKNTIAVVVRNVLLVMVLAGLVMLFSPLKIFGLAVLIGVTLPVIEVDRLMKAFKDQGEIRIDRISQLEAKPPHA